MFKTIACLLGSFFILLATCLLISSSANCGDERDNVARSLEWSWSDQRGGLFYSIERDRLPYQIELIRKPNDIRTFTLRFSKDNQTLFTYQAHPYTSFRCLFGILYYADYSFSGTGCTVVAFDLENRKELWRTKLKALGALEYSEYLNRLAIDVNDKNVFVWGDESMGRYVECLDVKTGATVGHKVFTGPGQPK